MQNKFLEIGWSYYSSVSPIFSLIASIIFSRNWVFFYLMKKKIQNFQEIVYDLATVNMYQCVDETLQKCHTNSIVLYIMLCQYSHPIFFIQKRKSTIQKFIKEFESLCEHFWIRFEMSDIIRHTNKKFHRASVFYCVL